MDGVKYYYWDWILLNKQLRSADFRRWQDVPISLKFRSGRRHQTTSAAQAKAATVVLEREKPSFVGLQVPVRACSFWWSQRNSCSINVVASECRLKDFWGSCSRLSAITHPGAELQVLLEPLTSSDSAGFHHKWCESYLSMNQIIFLRFCW